MELSYEFKTLERSEIDECAKLVARVFALYDPFIVELKITEYEMFVRTKSDLEKAVDDQLITICKTKTNKIIGCFVGFRWSNENFERKEVAHIPTHYKINDALSQEDRFNILVNIDGYMLGDCHELRKKRKELDLCVYSDYYCVAEEYFRSNLNAELIFQHFKRLQSKGIKYGYGSFFNPKAIKLVINY